MDEMIADIDALKARWMTGGSASGLGPKAWRDMDDLSLLVLAGQFSRIATRPETAAKTSMRSDIPELELPPMPPELRPQFRRILENKLARPADVVGLIAARGYCVNPVDWMPKRTEADLPAPYEAWRDWLEGNLPAEEEQQPLSAENWDMIAPSRRYQDLTLLHREKPEDARRLIAEVAPNVAADQRLRLLQCLRPALTDGDAELLQSFQSDRSSKVQSLIKTQLARLGNGPDSDEAALGEIADYVEIAKAGLLSRKHVVKPKKLKTEAQRKRRAKVFSQVSLTDLANAFQLTADDVIETWGFGNGTDDFLALVAASGTDAQVRRMIERGLEQDIQIPSELMDRLDTSTRLKFALKVIKSDDFSLRRTREWITTPEGNISWAALSAAKHLSDLIKAAVQAEKQRDEALASEALAFLGLIADRDAATRLLEQLSAAGVLAVDPRLTLLRLNAAL